VPAYVPVKGRRQADMSASKSQGYNSKKVDGSEKLSQYLVPEIEEPNEGHQRDNSLDPNNSDIIANKNQVKLL
jgi:hypothetical protein